MRQVPLDIQFPAPSGFDDFLIGDNLEAYTSLGELATQTSRELACYLYGEAGVGKSHLLRASVLASQHAGLAASYIDARLDSIESFQHGDDVLAIDQIDALDDGQQEALFRLFNAQRESGKAILTAGRLPPGQMPLRPDLQTRLAWGLQYCITSPADDDKAALLRHRAGLRGCPVSEDVCRYLVRHSQRDLGSLTSLLDELDRLALAQKRPLSVALAREMLMKSR